MITSYNPLSFNANRYIGSARAANNVNWAAMHNNANSLHFLPSDFFNQINRQVWMCVNKCSENNPLIYEIEKLFM